MFFAYINSFGMTGKKKKLRHVTYPSNTNLELLEELGNDFLVFSSSQRTVAISAGISQCTVTMTTTSSEHNILVSKTLHLLSLV